MRAVRGGAGRGGTLVRSYDVEGRCLNLWRVSSGLLRVFRRMNVRALSGGKATRRGVLSAGWGRRTRQLMVRDAEAQRVAGDSSWWPQIRRIKVMGDYILRQITWCHQRYFMMRSRRRMDALRVPRDSVAVTVARLGAAPEPLSRGAIETDGDTFDLF